MILCNFSMLTSGGSFSRSYSFRDAEKATGRPVAFPDRFQFNFPGLRYPRDLRYRTDFRDWNIGCPAGRRSHQFR
jgi:hypothetical protein